MFCGFDIGGTKVLGVAIDSVDAAQPVAVHQDVTLEDGDALIDTIQRTVTHLENRCQKAFTAIGVGIAGIVDRDGVLRYSPNIDGVFNLDIRRELRARLSRPIRPIVVENDATAAVWAESQLGAGRGSRHLALVSLGTGIGTGFVLDGRLYHGWNGFAGESGHMIVEQTGPEHITGARGPWEYFGSGTALSRMARDAAARGEFDRLLSAVPSLADVQGEHVHTLIAAGDIEALAVLDKFCYYVAVGVANLVHVFDPETVIISGGLVDIGEPLLRGIESWTRYHVLGGQRRPSVQIVPAQLGSQAGAVGAALLAAEVA